MLFNSLDFALFLPIVFILYRLFEGKTYRNSVLLLSSYYFYGSWDWRFLILIAASTVIDFVLAQKIHEAETHRRRRTFLIISLVSNLGMLMVFKYYNFFLENVEGLFLLFGKPLNVSSLNIILPVGISFYTFQTLSYTIDVFRRKIEPTQNLLAFSAFVSFFPQLVAGPIERAERLLPQFFVARQIKVDHLIFGLKLILWGLFKKMVVADNCAVIANTIFNNHEDHSGLTLFLGAVMFAFQIYGDFSGYSDMAIGTAKLFGINLMTNFRTPYFSRNIAEFWRRWHISLSTWFRDYLYIPLGGSKISRGKALRNIFIVFLVSGFWHGANWTFILWGLFHACLFLPDFITKKNRKYLDSIPQMSVATGFKMLSTFVLVTLAWILFRAETVSQAGLILSKIFSSSILEIPTTTMLKQMVLSATFVTILLVLEWIGRHSDHAIVAVSGRIRFRFLRWSFYAALFFIIGMFMQTDSSPFIYFQF